mmetsp:Transcript_46430/g.67891  ORF Transcript_46430/g.67891 Transcript_46430/m.67891 type:complete len:96 (-) Transcript_46430:214-501(-)
MKRRPGASFCPDEAAEGARPAAAGTPSRRPCRAPPPKAVAPGVVAVVRRGRQRAAARAATPGGGGMEEEEERSSATGDIFLSPGMVVALLQVFGV